MLLTLMLLAGCAAPEPPPAPPPACPVVPPARGAMAPLDKPPVSAVPLTLEPGHWDWTGRTFVWSPPRWVTAHPGGVLWMAGSWTRAADGGCLWNAAHFISPGG